MQCRLVLLSHLTDVKLVRSSSMQAKEIGKYATEAAPVPAEHGALQASALYSCSWQSILPLKRPSLPEDHTSTGVLLSWTASAKSAMQTICLHTRSTLPGAEACTLATARHAQALQGLLQSRSGKLIPSKSSPFTHGRLPSGTLFPTLHAPDRNALLR